MRGRSRQVQAGRRPPHPAFGRLLPRGEKAIVAGVAAALLGAPALAQEAGWSYSPLPGEGDRAALGCAYGATAESYTCLAVRCEDDFSVGVHIHTSRPAGDAGRWVLEFDREMQRFAVTAVADGSPYHARIEGEVSDILDNLLNAGLVYLDPADDAPFDRAISLSGSMTAIRQALYFCAPRVTDDTPADLTEGAAE